MTRSCSTIPLLGIHAGQGADDDLGARFVACFVQAADDTGLPDDPGFRASLRAYMEWAVGEVLSNVPPLAGWSARMDGAAVAVLVTAAPWVLTRYSKQAMMHRGGRVVGGGGGGGGTRPLKRSQTTLPDAA